MAADDVTPATDAAAPAAAVEVTLRPEARAATHLVVLQHGLLGSERDFTHFEQLFITHLQPAHGVYVHAARCNGSGLFQTFDGIDAGAQRLADEIKQVAAQMPALNKFSIVGHSLGGLYARYCVGVLLARGFFASVEPMNFITLATPHLGIRRPQRGSMNFIHNKIMPKLFDKTGQQFMLTDAASEFTLALSRCSAEHKELPSYPMLDEMKGSLLLWMIEATSSESFSDGLYDLHHCVLKDHVLRIYQDQMEQDASDERIDEEIDLRYAKVTVVIPESAPMPKTSFTSSFFSRKSRLSGRWSLRRNRKNSVDEINDPDRGDETIPVSMEPTHIKIRWAPAGSAGPDQERVCVVRIPAEEMERNWKWLVAISNTSYGVHCASYVNDQNHDRSVVVPPTPSESIVAPQPLLSCLTNGQFMQALLLFKARTLYANVFFDMQVPYSCGSIRAFNPYRMDANKCVESTHYHHLLQQSIASAPLIRDTRATFAKEQLSKGSHSHKPRRNSRKSRTSSSTEEEAAAASHVQTNARGMPWDKHHQGSSFSSDGVRSEPFVDSGMLVDHVHEAFSSDPARDLLRGMLLSLQSAGWRRIDVLFDNVLAHEHIIAKRAKLDKPWKNGVDVVFHVMDSFVL